MNKPNNSNAFENSWNEMTKTFQNQFSTWLKMSGDYFDHMTDLQTKMFQNIQQQFGVANENAEQIFPVAKFTANTTPKEKAKKPNEALNMDIIAGDWKQLMGDAQKQWSKLTNDNLTQINGSREKLAGALQKNYGIARAEAEKQMEDWEKSRIKTLKAATN